MKSARWWKEVDRQLPDVVRASTDDWNMPPSMAYAGREYGYTVSEDWDCDGLQGAVYCLVPFDFSPRRRKGRGIGLGAGEAAKEMRTLGERRGSLWIWWTALVGWGWVAFEILACIGSRCWHIMHCGAYH